MIDSCFINPFSTDAKEIVTLHGDISSVDRENRELTRIIEYTHNQRQTRDVIPTSIMQLATKRFKWFLFKNTEEYNEKDYKYLFNPEIYEYDVVAFYLLAQAIAIVFGSDSHEAKLLIEQEAELVDRRLDYLNTQPDSYDTEYIDEALSQLCNTNNLYWTNIKEVLDTGQIRLDELLISDGQIIIEFEDFIEKYEHVIEGRTPRSMYEMTCGSKVKTKLLKSFIMYETREYLKQVEEKSQHMVEPSPVLNHLADDIKTLQQDLQQVKFGSSNSSGVIEDQPVPYQLELFPPCVRKCLRGIKSGGRNDAIVLFLTPFLSYARLFPGIFKLEGTPIKVSDVDPTLEITNNEVIPLIYEAANNCTPPLFKDQPQEKININSKLGFGMHETINSENEGQTDWYTPMSCEKIKLHMPQLCVPNAGCKKIGNPLTYYNRMRMLQSREDDNTSSNTSNSSIKDNNSGGK